MRSILRSRLALVIATALFTGLASCAITGGAQTTTPVYRACIDGS
jgi:hypothetical protein